MKASVGLEYIGANSDDAMRQLDSLMLRIGLTDKQAPRRGPAVAEIARSDSGAIVSHFLSGQRDYSRANSKGSRGIYVRYILEEDRLYWIREPKSWRRIDCYYAAITPDGVVYRLTRKQVDEWLNAA